MSEKDKQTERQTERHEKIEEYDNDDDQDYAEQEYQDQMSKIIKTASLNDEIVATAIDLYLDDDFYPHVIRPHITVWIQWYRTTDDFDNIEEELAELEVKFKKMQKMRDHKRKVDNIWKR